jgi:hypothetical protein
MKLKLVVAFAVLLFGSVVHADSAQDDFSLYSGAYTFSLPATVTPQTDSSDNFLWLYGVTVDYNYMMPSAASFPNCPCVPVTVPLNASLFFLPVADDSWDLLNFGVIFFEGGSEETIGFVFPSDPFTLTNGQMNFIPGSYDNGWVTISDPPADSPSNVPEPSSMLLSAVGIVALIGLARKSPRDSSDTK